MDESWKEIVDESGGDPQLTLEDFLTKAGAVREEDVVKLPPVSASTDVEYSGVVDPMICSGAGSGARLRVMRQQHLQFGSAIGTSAGSSNGNRGKRKVVVEDPPVDKATQQKQRRMIKNRESTATSPTLPVALVKLAKWMVEYSVVPLRLFHERCEEEFLWDSEMIKIKPTDLKSKEGHPFWLLARSTEYEWRTANPFLFIMPSIMRPTQSIIGSPIIFI